MPPRTVQALAKVKLDELFSVWLCQQEAQDWIRATLSDFKNGITTPHSIPSPSHLPLSPTSPRYSHRATASPTSDGLSPHLTFSLAAPASVHSTSETSPLPSPHDKSPSFSPVSPVSLYVPPPNPIPSVGPSTTTVTPIQTAPVTPAVSANPAPTTTSTAPVTPAVSTAPEKPKSLVKQESPAVAIPPPTPISAQALTKALPIPQFYFPGGKPAPQEKVDAEKAQFAEIFARHPDGVSVEIFQDEVMRPVLGLPRWMARPFWDRMMAVAATIPGETLITLNEFTKYYAANLQNFDAQARFFRILKDPAHNYVTRDDWVPYIRGPPGPSRRRAPSSSARHCGTLPARYWHHHRSDRLWGCGVPGLWGGASMMDVHPGLDFLKSAPSSSSATVRLDPPLVLVTSDISGMF
ncbi:hypothetical protein PAPYR_1159 [Paratrimastix pyriformis]|uniref:Uncharacterized protein n=1 Tax=Paratrimastix pyriformis TaxID=342808 RepID=A0ABQ8UW77_9EUKA|nr:hypothetical protein PAPYR_1159 [Paratrimastix pyriformis]